MAQVTTFEAIPSRVSLWLVVLVTRLVLVKLVWVSLETGLVLGALLSSADAAMDSKMSQLVTVGTKAAW